jgi:hypothetical protein
VADITALVAVDFMRVSKLAVPDTICSAGISGFGAPERGGVGLSEPLAERYWRSRSHRSRSQRQAGW